tara:strand:+ start:237 stop:581 length:345 start_codon:yes stop_codon:yes gene_type:complete
MFRAIRDIGIVSLVWANINIITRLGTVIVLFFAIEIIYSKWLAPELNLSQDFLRLILYAYTFIQFLLVIWFLYSLRNFVWGEKAKKVIEAKKSFENMPKSFKDILDVKKFPNLK